jgi:hypothetical protein
LNYLTAKLAALLPFGKVADLLGELLPASAGHERGYSAEPDNARRSTTRETSQPFLNVRVAVINGTLEQDFRKWHRNFPRVPDFPESAETLRTAYRYSTRKAAETLKIT